MSIGPSLPRGESLHKIVCITLQWGCCGSTCSSDMWYTYQLRASCHFLRPNCCARYADYLQLVYAFQKRWREMEDPLARLALLLDRRQGGACQAGASAAAAGQSAVSAWLVVQHMLRCRRMHHQQQQQQQPRCLLAGPACWGANHCKSQCITAEALTAAAGFL
jgi:hypothetical protein